MTQLGGVVFQTGGAMIGWINATWPFARLEASAGHISLSVAILGTFSFSPEEVAAIEPEGNSRFFSSTLQIVHTNPEFPKTLIFSCFGQAHALLDEIRAVGFRPRARRDQIPVRSGPPFRWTFIGSVFLLTNALAFLDGRPWDGQPEFGVGELAPLATIFLLSVSIARSTWLQALALKPGRYVSESQAFVRLLQLITGFLLIMFFLA